MLSVERLPRCALAVGIAALFLHAACEAPPTGQPTVTIPSPSPAPRPTDPPPRPPAGPPARHDPGPPPSPQPARPAPARPDADPAERPGRARLHGPGRTAPDRIARRCHRPGVVAERPDRRDRPHGGAPVRSDHRL